MAKPRHRYRSIPLHLNTSDAFRELSLEAKGLLCTLLLHCSYIGFGRFAPGVLAIEANATPERLDAALRELEAGGWIITDGNAVLIVDVLGWQPNYQPTNPNHRPNVENGIASIRSEKLVEAFWMRYPEWRLEPEVSGGGGDAIKDTISNGMPYDHEPSPIPADTEGDQGAASGQGERISKKEANSSLPAACSADEYSKTMAEHIDRGHDTNPRLAKPLHGVRPDVAAAAELLAASIPLSFAAQVATEVGMTYTPAEGSPQIVSTRYVNAAVTDRWRLAGLSGDRSSRRDGGSRRRSAFRDGGQGDSDRALNKDERVHEAVREHVTLLNAQTPGSGDAWLDQMKAEARLEGRWAYPFAYDWLRDRRADRTPVVPQSLANGAK